MRNLIGIEVDFFETEWGKIIKEKIEEETTRGINQLQIVKNELAKYPELQKFYEMICFDIQKIEELQRATSSWDKAYDIIKDFKFDRWPISKKVDLEAKDRAKEIREKVKKEIQGNLKKIVNCTSEEIKEDMQELYETLTKIKNIIVEFDERFYKKKREKNIVDFNDIEHLALKILVKEDEEGKIVKTDIAKKYEEKFLEIAIDEYQDSNEVQEYILTSVSKGNNIFMVGDVKQSIYKFRQARPELFLDKYKKYKLKERKTEKDGLKIKLFKNFRSRENILDVTNLIFENIMSEDLGSIEYNEAEYLNFEADYPEPQEEIDYAGKTELYIIDKKDDEAEETIQAFKGNFEASQTFNNENEETNEENAENDFEYIEDIVVEAKFVANKIQEIINSDYQVWDKKMKQYRKVQYKDIVVLLRSTQVPAPIFEKEITELNMPVFSDISAEYLGTMEIQIIMNILKIIDNPLQDIPLVTTLRSSIWNFTDNELIQIRLVKQKTKYYEALVQAQESEEIPKELKNKIAGFLAKIEEWRQKEKYLGLDELIWQIYMETGFYNYVSLLNNGELKQSNLKLLFEKARQYEKASFKGLYNFINFINKLQEKKSSKDMSSAKIIGENDNVIRIMSIHKSKGLEFPVVFLSATGKQFNQMDMNDQILLHQDIGIGAKYINYKRRIEYSTVAREAIKIISKNELLSEEMRVLYVALTRAKEKLIITGISKDVKKELEEKMALIDSYKKVEESEKINKAIVAKAKSYLDWIEYVYQNTEKEKLDEIIQLKILYKNEILKMINKEEAEKEDIIEKINSQCKEQTHNAEDFFDWEYKNKEAIFIPNKTSVSKIKEMKIAKLNLNKLESKTNEGKVDEVQMAEDEIKMSERKMNEIQKVENVATQVILEKIQYGETETQEKRYKKEMAMPKFLSEKSKTISNAKKGTLMHLVIQKLDEKREYTLAEIQEIIKDLVENQIIMQNEADAINVSKVHEFTKTSFFTNLKKAKQIKKEEPFYLNVPAKEVYKQAGDENILVQGIIDLYYIDENDKLVLVDYKTDYVEEENELKEKYEIQLELYKQALEKSLNRTVDKIIIYSLYKMKAVIL